MTHWKQYIAISIVIGMLHLTMVDVIRAGETPALPTPAAVKQQVDLFGVGAKVKVRLVDGQKLALLILYKTRPKRKVLRRFHDSCLGITFRHTYRDKHPCRRLRFGVSLLSGANDRAAVGS